MKKILIIGAGRRVTKDLLPSLLYSGVNPDSILVVRRQMRKIEQFPEITISNNLEKTLSNFSGDIVFCCVSHDAQNSVIASLRMSEKRLTILFDTPVMRAKDSLRDLCQHHAVSVLEETPLIPWIDKIKEEFSEGGIVIFWRCLFYYHGVSFIRELFHCDGGFKLNLPFGKQVLLFSAIKKRIIMAGYPKASSGKLLYIPLKLSSTNKIFGLNTSPAIAQEILDWQCFLSWRTFNEKQYHSLREGHIFKDINIWKNLALIIGTSKLIRTGISIFPSLDEATRNEDF